MNRFPLKLVFDLKSGETIVRCAFTRNRFLKLCNRLRFDDKSSRNQRRERDLFAPIRDLWEQFLKTLKRHYIPGVSVTVDEQLVPWRGRCSFLQYLPSKPDKYGIKIFWAVDSETFFPLNAVPYLGKVGRLPTVNLGRNTALQLVKPFYRSGRNLTCDNFFTDYELAQKLNTEKMSVVGTLRRNKRFIPAEFQDPKLTEKGQPKFCFQKDAMLVSYKSGAKKNVILLSSMHSDSTIVVNKHEKELPEVMSYYNSTKGGVDTMDLMAHTVSSKRQTKRWPMLMLYNIIDVGSIAASVVYSTKYPVEKFSKTDNRREFQLNVSKDLILPQIERRRQTNRLPK
ncbi:PiggyBac transposable element-derived protein 4 [Plakobranchus ocellatus]|uniref:PiggyBac transposable element-derived protein 4 n=1 Tax=Plakobranchus ocellatus TaxID=259542 RepID=A0AAV3YLX2_9GAST|nr:PiggyBac transposable element-derived protein 4 [Plakobranchus ocellatus]